jgi:cytochrome c oxidase cbb3-type subunit 3
MIKPCLLFCASICFVASAQQWPDGAGKETTLQLCGTCHKPDVIQEHRQSRDDWKASIQKMIAAGAEGSPDQFTAVLDYVSKNFGPAAGGSSPATAQAPADTGGPPAGRGGRGGRGGGGGGGGRRAGGFTQFTRPLAPQDVLARGKALYETNCASCHAPDLRGSPTGVNLLRSMPSLSDQHGEIIGAEIAKHKSRITLIQTDTVAVAEYIHSILATTGGQGSPPGRNPVGLDLNILVGDAKAGQAYFANACASCHSVTGDLKGFASKYPDPRSLQNAWVAGSGNANPFGGRGGGGQGNPVTVTMPDGKKLQGKLVRKDDFIVVLTLADGTRKAIARDGDMPKVDVKDPNEAHKKMVLAMDDPENKNMHDVTAYLATLK